MSSTLAIPDTSEAMTEFLLDDKKRNQVFATDADPATLTAFMNQYAKLNAKVDPGVSEQVQQQIDRTLANFVREHGVAEFRKGSKKLSLAEVREQKASSMQWSASADGAKLNGLFDTLQDFLEVADKKADPRDPRVAERRASIKNAMSSTDPASGGFLIPEEFRADLLRVALETALVRPRARVIPMGSLRAAIPTINSSTNVGSIYGGVIAYWTEEAAALTQSQPEFGRIVLEAKKLTAYTEVPNELREDSAITVEALLSEIFPQAIAWFEDIAFLTGTGAGEPLGVFHTNNTATVVVAKETNQVAATIVWENIIKMYSRMLPSSLGSAIWVVTNAAFVELATMALTVGTGGSAVWLNNGVEGPPMMILGRPVVISEKVSALGTQGDINFVDLKQYLIGDRMAMDAKVSDDYRFGNDMTAYRFIERVDGRPWMASAVTPANSGPTLSPYVTLATRA